MLLFGAFCCKTLLLVARAAAREVHVAAAGLAAVRAEVPRARLALSALGSRFFFARN